MTTKVASYKDSPYLDWKLFPDFKRLLTLTEPTQAVPIFQALLNDTRERFLALEKSFEPTWEGSIGKRKQNTLPSLGI